MPVLFAEEVAPERKPRGVCAGLLLITAALLQAGCAARVESSHLATVAVPSPTPTPAAVKEIRIDDSLVREDELTYKGYTVRKSHREVREADAPGGRVKVDYAVLERRGKVLRSFDAGVYNGGLGNSVAFGLFPFLGGEERQLIVSQDAPRAGAQWVVSLSPRPRVIYDGPAFAAGREVDDLRVEDLDGDGVYEIVAPICAFYGFRDWALAPADTPLPSAVFKYDLKAGKYLPANQLFRERLLKDVEEMKSKVRGPEARGSHLADVLSIVLSYVYAGEEGAGWEFYDAAYGLPDKAEVKREVERVLRGEPVHRFMQQSPRR